MAPPSQKAGDRPISFFLSDDLNRQSLFVPLSIRPEDLTKSEPSSLTAQRTLGGAWIDNFGPGLATIQISGHTGWRGDQNGSGIDLFTNLRSNVFEQWHKRRADAVDKGQDPDLVKLIFSDALDDFVNVVAPTQFVLKRSRSRPLLMMYQISMTVVADHFELPVNDEIADESDDAAADESLADSITKIEALRTRVPEFVDPITAPTFQDMLSLANGSFSRVRAVVAEARGFISAPASLLIATARDLALVCRNAIYAYSAVASIATTPLFLLSQLGSALDNVFCILSNAFRRRRQYPDYSDLYGASGCSSTIGGSPLSPLRDVNPFELVIQPADPIISVAPTAALSIAALKATDPVLAPLSVAVLQSNLASIHGGVILQ